MWKTMLFPRKNIFSFLRRWTACHYRWSSTDGRENFKICPLEYLPNEMRSLFHRGLPKNGNQRRQIILNSSLFYFHWPRNIHEPQRCAYLVYPARRSANRCRLREVFWRSPFELPFIFSSYHFKDSISLVMPVMAACWILEIFPMVWSSLSVFHISNGIRMVTRLSCMVLPPLN